MSDNGLDASPLPGHLLGRAAEDRPARGRFAGGRSSGKFLAGRGSSPRRADGRACSACSTRWRREKPPRVRADAPGRLIAGDRLAASTRAMKDGRERLGRLPPSDEKQQAERDVRPACSSAAAGVGRAAAHGGAGQSRSPAARSRPRSSPRSTPGYKASQQGIQALDALPDTVAATHRSSPCSRSADGLLGRGRWIDQQTRRAGEERDLRQLRQRAVAALLARLPAVPLAAQPAALRLRRLGPRRGSRR